MDTKLFSRKQSGGFFSIYDAAVSTGEFFFVHSGTGSDTAGSGRNPDAPFASINYAFSSGAVTANKHDIVYVMPGHAEAGTADPFLDFTVAGVSVIGIGNGPDQPTVTHGHADAEVDISAAGITIENLHFIAGIDDVKICLQVDATDCTVRKCRFTGGSATLNYRICVKDAAANASARLTIEGCYALMIDTENTHFVNFEGTPDGCIVRDNVLLGDWGTMCIGGAGVITFAVITGNMIHNVATTVDSCIQLPNASTGICAYNMCGGGAAVANGIDAVAMTNGENYYQIHTADLSGLLDPPNA